MRFFLTSAAALIAGALLLSAGATSASAAPLLSVPYLADASIGVQQVDWRRRYYRRNGVWPPVSVPRAMVEDEIIDDVIVAPDAPVVRIFPPRPASCGEFHYWDGERCLDARYHDPYVGRR